MSVFCNFFQFSFFIFFVFFFFFFNDTATTEIYTLSLHDALPISFLGENEYKLHHHQSELDPLDRKSTRLNSSHQKISYAVFCLKKKKETNLDTHTHTPKEKQTARDTTPPTP